MPAHRKPTHRKKVVVAALGMALAGSGVAFAVQGEEEPVASAPQPMTTTSAPSSAFPSSTGPDERDLRPSRDATERREKLKEKGDRSKGKRTQRRAASPRPSETAVPTPTLTPEPKQSVDREPTSQSTTPTQEPSHREGGIVGGTNAARADAGLPALSVSACLTDLAERHAHRLAASGSLQHQDISAVMNVCGLSTAGENVAMNYTGPTAMVAQWMDSSGHRANILNGRFSLIGVGTAQAPDGSWYGVQVFGDK
ncbi:MAG TPA: CAP domain-containing protein [Nocardioidaceae bacterium]|nr:CAP domain-containing protein [Nocardioidaceae bacterium]